MGVPRVTGDFWSEQSKKSYIANRPGCLSQKDFVRQECIKFMIDDVRFWIYLRNLNFILGFVLIRISLLASR